jgi:uncharacterized membrane protein (DUF2068 family)
LNEPSQPRRERKPLLLLWIASLKLLKAGFLIATGVAALELIRPEIGEHLLRWAEEIQHDFHRDVTLKALQKLLKLEPAELRLVALGTFLYAALFIIEGIGLWMDKLWAEWLTIVSTGALIPIELCELAREFSGLKVAVLIVNIFVVIYLIRRLRIKHWQRLNAQNVL